MSDPVSILFVNPNDTLRPEIARLLEYFSEREYELHVLLPEACRETASLREAVTYHFYPAKYVPNIRYTIPKGSFVRLLVTLLDRVQVVHIIDYDYLPSALAALLASRSNAVSIMTIDALPGVDWSYGSTVVDWVAKVYTHTLGRVVFASVDSIVGLGGYVTETLRTLTDTDVYRIPNGIDTARYSPGETETRDFPGPARTVRLLYVGRLDTVKGVTYLLQAMERLNDSDVREYELTIVGDGSKRAEYESLCEELDVADRVEFEGWQSDVVPYYRSHDIFVLPSISEGQSTVLMEAQACGTPVVSTDVGGAKELVGAGAVVRPRDGDALAKVIDELAEQNGPALRERARTYSLERFSYQRMGEAYASLYASHLSGHSPKARAPIE